MRRCVARPVRPVLRAGLAHPRLPPVHTRSYSPLLVPPSAATPVGEAAWSVETFFRPSSDETQVDAATLRALAKRAQLRIPPEKEESLCREVGQILSCVRIIQEVDTEGVDPLVSPLDARLGEQQGMRLRKDEVTDGNIVEELMRNAPARDASFFTVPKVKGQAGGEGDVESE